MIPSLGAGIARGRHNVYRFLAGAYLREPTRPIVSQIRSRPFLSELGDIFGAKNIYWLKEFSRSFDGNYDQLLTEYAALFKVPANRYVTPYKSAYADLLPPGKDGGSLTPALRALTGFRGDGGQGLTSLCSPLGEYVGHELEFMSRLSEEEALSQSEGDDDLALCYRSIQRGTLERHLGRWIDPLVDKLQKKAVSYLFKGIGEITRAFVLSDRRYLEKSTSREKQAT